MIVDATDSDAHVTSALLSMKPGVDLHIPLQPMGEPEHPAWADQLGTVPRALLDEHGWSGPAPERSVWLGRVGCTVSASLAPDACTLVLSYTTSQPPLVPPRLARLPALATQVCALNQQFPARVASPTHGMRPARPRVAPPLSRAPRGPGRSEHGS